ncbi:MAG: hypothetical protein KF883_00860 [Thermomicrobiales bacterium]|jgi:hypothetical protein|nr:hypothetical protein [Thermomicrobiales bacterium]MCC6943065.1 hypothetical protein [Thermomicrobiales bacterium]
MRGFFSKWNIFQSNEGRFGRYYTSVIGQGSGYPTADEARRDLQRLDQRQGGSWIY